MYGIKFNLQGGITTYLAKNKNGEYKMSGYRKNMAEFEDEYDAIDAATETAKKIYGKQIEFTLLWHA